MRQLKITKSITLRESPVLEKYLQEINKEDLITVEEETELAYKIKGGDQAASEKLIRANLRFVVSVAKQYQNQGLSLPDLINEGNFGLIKATKKFDPSRGFKFISYAIWWIRQSILVAIAENIRTVRLPLNQMALIHKINKAHAKLEQEYERTPSPEEMADLMGKKPDDVNYAISVSGKNSSLDAPFHGGEETLCLLDVLTNNESTSSDSDSVLINESLQKQIEASLSLIPEKESDVLRMLFGIGCSAMSYLQISKKTGLSETRIGQIKKDGIRHLRYGGRSKFLRQYLG